MMSIKRARREEGRGRPIAAAAEELRRVLSAFAVTQQKAFEAASAALALRLRRGGKALVFGNGGSAAQAQHFAAELVNGIGRRDGPPLAALALTADTSCLTAVGNDRSFAQIFSRQIEALGRAADVAIGLTASGESADIVEGLRAARRQGLLTICLTGESGGKAARASDHALRVPSRSTPRVQEAHLILLHVLAERLERELGGRMRRPAQSSGR